MLQVARSAGVIGVPRLGPESAPEAHAGPVARTSAASLDVNMAHAPVRVDRPARRAVVVLADERGWRHDARALSAMRDDLGARRLRLAGVVPGARQQHRRSAVPLPRDAKARE